MPAHIVHGDDYMVNKTLRQIVRDAGLQDLLQTNQHEFDARTAAPDIVIDTCKIIPFLDIGRLVTVRGILNTRERGQQNPARTPQRRRSQPPAGWDKLASSIPDLPDHTLLLIIDDKVSANNPLLKTLAPVCNVHRVNPPTSSALKRWIEDMVEERSATIRNNATNSLADLLGEDLWALEREIDKLTLYCHNRPITLDDVDLMVNRSQEANVFAAIDAMFENRTARALQAITRLMVDGAEPLYLLTMINRQARIMALAIDMSGRRRPNGEIAAAMGTKSDFVVQKAIRQTRHHTIRSMQSIYHRVLQADLDIKQGRIDPNLAIELLTVDIAESIT